MKNEFDLLRFFARVGCCAIIIIPIALMSVIIYLILKL